MSVDLDPSDEFAQWADGLENVTLRRRDSGETIAITVALRRDALAQEAEPSGGAARQTDAVWHLQLPTGESSPELGDVVIDARDNHWTIQQTEELLLLGALEVQGTRVASGVWLCGPCRCPARGMGRFGQRT